MSTITRHRTQLSRNLADSLRKLEHRFNLPIEFAVTVEREDYSSYYLKVELNAEMLGESVSFSAMYNELYFGTAVASGNLGIYRKTANELAQCFETTLNQFYLNNGEPK